MFGSCGDANHPTVDGGDQLPMFYDYSLMPAAGLDVPGGVGFGVSIYPEYFTVNETSPSGVYPLLRTSATKSTHAKLGDNVCVGSTGALAQRWGMPEGDASREACGDACSVSADCSGFEWYAGGWNGHKCHRVLNGPEHLRAISASSDARVLDAECWAPRHKSGRYRSARYFQGGTSIQAIEWSSSKHVKGQDAGYW